MLPSSSKLDRPNRSFRRRLSLESLEGRRLLTGGGLVVGTNLAFIADFDAVAFVDVMNQSRLFQTAEAVDSGPYNTGKASLMPVDANGWPLQSPFDPGDGSPMQIAHTVVPVRGAGTYTFVGKGTGTLTIRASGGLVDPTSQFQRTVDVVFTGGEQTIELEIYDTQWGDGTGDLFVYFAESDPTDPIRDLDLVSPGGLATYQTDPFLDSYTDDLAKFGNLRFMDWLATNGNPVQNWADRTVPEMNTQARPEGVSLEWVVAMANATMQDPWINVPAQASDDYVENMAAFLRDHLDPSLKVFVEYSNETWNAIFSQSGFVRDAGVTLGLDANPFRAANKFHAMRSAQVWSMFDTAFAADSSSRLVKIMATQMVSETVTNLRLDALSDPAINPTGIMPDALAVNAYFGGSLADQIVAEGRVDEILVSEILTRLDNDRTGRMDADLKKQKAIADANDLWLVTYEGGQHLAGTGANDNNAVLTEKLIATNRDPQMYSIYQDYLTQLADNDVVLHSNFSYVFEPGRFGSWGLKETQEQPLTEAHKFRAVVDWIDANPSSNQLPRTRLDGETRRVDDGDGVETFKLDASRSRDFDGAIADYIWMRDGVVIGSGATIHVDVPVGTDTVTLTVVDNEGGESSTDITIQVASNESTGLLVQAEFAGPPAAGNVWNQTASLNEEVLYSGWTIGSGFRPSGLSPGLGFRGTFGPTVTTLSRAIIQNEYLSVSVQADPARPDRWIDLAGAEFAFSISRATSHSPRRFAVMSSIGGFDGSDILYDTGPIFTESEVDFSFWFPSGGFYTGDPIEFRIYGYEGQFGNKDAWLTEFTLRGATPISPNALPPTDIVLSSTSANERVFTSSADRVFAELAAVDASSDDTHVFALVGGEGDADNGRFEIDGTNLRLRATETLDFETRAAYDVRLRVTDGTGQSFERSFALTVNDVVEVDQVHVHEVDALQRSKVNTVTIKFAGQVMVAADAFTVVHRTDPSISVGYTFETPTMVGGQTVVVLRLTGDAIRFGSLVDGYYDLTIDPSKVVSLSGLGLDADRNGTTGDAYAFGNRAGDRFFRYFGDIDGNGRLTIADFSTFRRSYGRRVSDVGYNALMDFDGNGFVSLLDFAEFRRRYGRTLPGAVM